jgi:hypothetical protein
MTTWPGFIPNTDIDQDSPITQPLVTALRDGPLAIAEADASTPLDLLPSVLLGTLTTTSGTAQSLTSLDLTPFKTLKAFFSGVSVATSLGSLQFAGQNIVTYTAVSETVFGMVEIDLFSGDGFSAVSLTASASGEARGINTAITTASTSVSVSVTAGTFDAGSVRIYGCK